MEGARFKAPRRLLHLAQTEVIRYLYARAQRRIASDSIVMFSAYLYFAE